jgi:segregation and condensation protein A
MLLPRSEGPADADTDPRLELVRQLMEYKKYKDAAALLEAQAERRLSRLPRAPVELPAPPDPAQQPLRQVEVWDLVSAFGRLMRETLALQPQQIIVDQTPVHIYMDSIRHQLQTEPRLAFAAVFTPPHTRARLVGLFLALLELIRAQEVVVEQPEVFGEIWLAAASGPAADQEEPGHDAADHQGG